MTILILIGAFALLLAGGDALVRGSVGVAQKLGVSPLVIGITLVGFGTSTPELVASVQAALIGSPGIAVGNIVGSNIANILLILGISAILLPIAATRQVLRRDGTVLLATSLLMVLIALSGSMDRWVGAVLITLLAIYTLTSFILSRREGGHGGDDGDEGTPTWPSGLWLSLLVAVGGIVGVVVGADLLVSTAITLAKQMGISEAVVGLTVVAIGTSLPELATSVLAAVRRQGQVALGNIIGSNVFNILGIGGVTVLIAPLPIPKQIVELDIWVMALAAVLLVVFAALGRGIGRIGGACLLAMYVAYITLQFSPSLRAAIGV